MLKALRRRWAIRRIFGRSRDDDTYLFSSPENARRLMAAIQEAESGEGLRVESLDELREQLRASQT